MQTADCYPYISDKQKDEYLISSWSKPKLDKREEQYLGFTSLNFCFLEIALK